MGITSGEYEKAGIYQDESSAISTAAAAAASLVAPSSLSTTKDGHLSLANNTASLNPMTSTRNNPEKSTIASDPFHLERFVRMQSVMLDTALSEIQAGQKQSCWLWFILPTAPYIVNGIEHGSSMNRRYALRSDDECLAYVENVSLRRNYIDVMNAIRTQLYHGNTMRHLFGSNDDVKAITSFRLFERIANVVQDEELSNLCRRVLNMVATKNNKSTDMKKRRMHWR
jgi:uncharacterized protein (DUF1810 family)